MPAPLWFMQCSRGLNIPCRIIIENLLYYCFPVQFYYKILEHSTCTPNLPLFTSIPQIGVLMNLFWGAPLLMGKLVFAPRINRN